MAQYEIEIKSLLGAKENAEALRAKMCELDSACACVSTNTQLNHYFKDGDLRELYKKTEHLFTNEQREKFKLIAKKGTDFSVRSRQRNDEVLLVVKASVDGGTSANSVSRLEFEESVALPFSELDRLILEAGFAYQAKWSREREEYVYKGANVCIDKNAGYGYLAEFEKILSEGEDITAARMEIEAIMGELGVEELSQDRLERMFAHYNEEWPNYYGTEKTFIIQ